jgi:hypothetical protein
MPEFDATVVISLLLSLVMMALGIATVYQASTASPQDKPNLGFGAVYMVASAAIMWGVVNNLMTPY